MSAHIREPNVYRTNITSGTYALSTFGWPRSTPRRRTRAVRPPPAPRRAHPPLPWSRRWRLGRPTGFSRRTATGPARASTSGHSLGTGPSLCGRPRSPARRSAPASGASNAHATVEAHAPLLRHGRQCPRAVRVERARGVHTLRRHRHVRPVRAGFGAAVGPGRLRGRPPGAPAGRHRPRADRRPAGPHVRTGHHRADDGRPQPRHRPHAPLRLDRVPGLVDPPARPRGAGVRPRR